MSIVKAFGMVSVGMVFGFCMQKAQVYKPEILFEQFTFESWLTLKIFLTIAAVSCLIQALMYVYDPIYFETTRPKEPFSYKRIALGTSILGAGMAVGGSCPGQAYVLLGSLSSYFISIYCGLLLGALVYYVSDEQYGLFIFKDSNIIKPIIVEVDSKQNNPNEDIIYNLKTETEEDDIFDGNLKELKDQIDECPTIDEDKAEFMDYVLGMSYPLLSLLMGIFLVLFVGMLEFLWPWQKDLIDSSYYWDSDSWNIFTQKSWPPWMGGVFVGLMQIPSRYFNGEGLGSATSTYGLISTVAEGVGFESKLSFTKSSFAFLQFIKMLIGVSVGSFLSAWLGGDLASMTVYEDMYSIRGFIGGFLLMFGSRYAGGCTSGHGLTGFSNLNMKSLVGTCSIFGTAILVGFLLNLIL